MWSSNYNINIVTSENSWFEPHAKLLAGELKKNSFQCNLYSSHEEVDEKAIVFYLSYMRIVPKTFISKTYQSLVVHASDLPKGKGFSPWIWQILEGKNDIPLCLFKMDEDLDTGDIFQKRTLYLEGDELLDQIRLSLAQHIKDMVLTHLIGDKEPKCFTQEGESTFYRRRTKEDSEIDVQKSILDQINLLRVVDNEQYPAYFYFMGKKYILRISHD